MKLYYSSSENKGADQLRIYWFSHDAVQLMIVSKNLVKCDTDEYDEQECGRRNIICNSTVKSKQLKYLKLLSLNMSL